MDLMNLEVNIPSTDFGRYTTLLASPPKFGKTEFCTYFDKALILDFENGAKGKVAYSLQVSKWSDVKKAVRQLVKEKALKEKYATICVDTVNYAIDACKDYLIDVADSQDSTRDIDTFNKIGFDKYELLKKEFTKTFNQLKMAGYGLVMVAHTKDKLVDRDKETERTMLMPDLNNPELNMVSGMADFYLVGENEVTILEPAVRNDDNKVVKPAVTSSKRILYLRRGEGAEGGFRWKHHVPNKIEFDFDKFKEVFNMAVNEEIKQGKEKMGINDEQANKIRKDLDKKEKDASEEVENAEENAKLSKKLEAENKKVKKLAEDIYKADKKLISKIKAIIGEDDPMENTDIEKTKTMIKELKKLSPAE